MKINRTTALIAYWAAALIIVAMILLSLDYSFAEALFMSSLFLPGVVTAKFFLAQVREDGSSKSVMNAVYIFGAIAVMEFLLVVCDHRFLEYIEEQNPLYLSIGVADILVNPIFVAVIIFLILAGEHLVLQMYKFEPEDSNMLGDNFICVHRSYIVRKEPIQETLHDSLILADGTSIPVSRKYRETVASLWAK